MFSSPCSTLDPVLRMEQRGINPQGIALLAAIFSYLFAKPGVLPGLLDMYIGAPLQRFRTKIYGRDDFVIGKKIATGGFGTVYRAELTDPEDGMVQQVVLKKATEFGPAEVWMNERMMRAAPKVAANFITAFADGRAEDPLWLVWSYEGGSTLADLMNRRDFPSSLEALLFENGAISDVLPGPEKKALVIRAAMQQLLEALRECHGHGIVHRDVKPQNCIVSENDRRVKLIDFGAAADLRVGINYVPNQYLLDPRYAPPEQYIMSSQTPRAPPAPVAAFLSPVLWQLNGPDKFDMYSAGITLLQLALPPLRSDNGLIAFNRALSETYGGNLEAWRSSVERRGGREWAEGFATLDAIGGGGWALALQLVQVRPQDRLSASAALAHPWFDPNPLIGTVTGTVETLGRAAGKVADADDGWLRRLLTRSSTDDDDSFTEAQLRDELGFGKTVSGGGGSPLYSASSTISWWKQRQSHMDARLQERQRETRMKRFVEQKKKQVEKQVGRNKVDEPVKSRESGSSLLVLDTMLARLSAWSKDRS